MCAAILYPSMTGTLAQTTVTILSVMPAHADALLRPMNNALPPHAKLMRPAGSSQTLHSLTPTATIHR